MCKYRRNTEELPITASSLWNKIMCFQYRASHSAVAIIQRLFFANDFFNIGGKLYPTSKYLK